MSTGWSDQACSWLFDPAGPSTRQIGELGRIVRLSVHLYWPILKSSSHCWCDCAPTARIISQGTWLRLLRGVVVGGGLVLVQMTVGLAH